MTVTERDDEARFGRLPQWAQREIKTLRANVDYYKAKLEVGPDESDTFLDASVDVQQPLGEGTTVIFYTDPEHKDSPYGQGAIQAHLTTRSGQRRLEVRSSDALLVRAGGANSIFVETTEVW